MHNCHNCVCDCIRAVLQFDVFNQFWINLMQIIALCSTYISLDANNIF